MSNAWVWVWVALWDGRGASLSPDFNLLESSTSELSLLPAHLPALRRNLGSSQLSMPC